MKETRGIWVEYGESWWEWGECRKSSWKWRSEWQESWWECKNPRGNVRNVGNQSGYTWNGVWMQRIRVELRWKLGRNVCKEAKRSSLFRLVPTNEILSHFWRKSSFPRFKVLTLNILCIFRNKVLVKRFLKLQNYLKFLAYFGAYKHNFSWITNIFVSSYFNSKY